jgi:hypothetical protein
MKNKNGIITISDRGRLAWHGWQKPFPSSVTAAESLWLLWRQQFTAKDEVPKVPWFRNWFGALAMRWRIFRDHYLLRRRNPYSD